LFDGVRVLCSWWVRFVIERNTGARFRFVAIQTPRGSALATRLGVDVANPETNVAIINGRAYFKSDATIWVLAGPGRGYSCCFPRARDWAYDRIARNRYRLFGRNESSRPDIGDRGSLRARRAVGGATVTGLHTDRRKAGYATFSLAIMAA
jgi:predicted DCC family thiol-disulfide oxidoreductase YuxK